jgi:predicted transglutaminase-like cysteine proteinase
VLCYCKAVWCMRQFPMAQFIVGRVVWPRAIFGACAMAGLLSACHPTAYPPVQPSVEAVAGPVIADPDMIHSIDCAAHVILKDEISCQSRRIDDPNIPPVDLSDSARWAELFETNADVNRDITYDVKVSWEAAKGKNGDLGNCTVFARRKFNRLAALGWPLEQMWMAEAAVNSTKRNHAFVLVRGRVGGSTGLYVLSSGIDMPVPIDKIARVNGQKWNQVIAYTHADVFRAQELEFPDLR